MNIQNYIFEPMRTELILGTLIRHHNSHQLDCYVSFGINKTYSIHKIAVIAVVQTRINQYNYAITSKPDESKLIY